MDVFRFVSRLLVGLAIIVLPQAAAALPASATAQAAPLPEYQPPAALPVTVSVGMVVNKITQINEQTGTFAADVDIMYRWQDPRQAFDKTAVGIDRQEFRGPAAQRRLAAMWTPALELANLTAPPMRQEQGLYIFADGTVQLVHRLTGVFETQYNLRAFPFDSQRLAVRIVSSKYGMGTVRFISEQQELDASGLRQGVAYQGWDMGMITFRPGKTTAWDGASFSALTAAVEVKRKSVSHVFFMYLPILILFSIPLFSLWDSGMKWTQRLGYLSGNTLSFIAFNFTITMRYPALDVESAPLQIFRIGFAFFFVMMLLVVTIYNEDFAHKYWHKDYVTEVHRFLRWGTPAVLFSVIFYTLLSSINS